MELNGELISIVIPVYNVKEYLEECLISVVNQSYTNLEIILVDDGSKDGSTEICKKFAENDSRIRLLLQDNHGVAYARNAGVQVATGEYLGFVDADDYIDGEYIEKLAAFIQKVDVVTAGYYMDYETSRSEAIFDKLAFGYYKTDDEYRYVIENMIRWNCGEEIGVSPFLVNKLYRRKILMGVIGQTDTTLYFGEDSDVLYRYLLQAKSIYISDICGYHYRMRSNSAVHSSDDRYLLNVGKLYWRLKDVFAKHESGEVLVKQLQAWIMRMVDKAPRRMGFPMELHSMEFLFPYINLLDGKRVALYGAGAVGKSYHRQIEKFEQCEEVVWVDEMWEKYRREGLDVKAIRCLKECEYDYIVIAVKDKSIADTIKGRLVQQGIAENTILWKKPLTV